MSYVCMRYIHIWYICYMCICVIYKCYAMYICVWEIYKLFPMSLNQSKLQNRNTKQMWQCQTVNSMHVRHEWKDLSSSGCDYEQKEKSGKFHNSAFCIVESRVDQVNKLPLKLNSIYFFQLIDIIKMNVRSYVMSQADTSAHQPPGQLTAEHGLLGRLDHL